MQLVCNAAPPSVLYNWHGGHPVKNLAATITKCFLLGTLLRHSASSSTGWRHISLLLHST